MPLLALTLLSIAWGSTFVVVKASLASTSPVLFLVLRFALSAAFAVAIALAWRAPRTPHLLRDGAASGLALFGGFAFQTEGLRLTTAPRSAFISALYVILVPFFCRILFGKIVPRRAWVAAVLAFSGLLLLTDASRPDAGGGRLLGDLLTFLAAVCYAVQIILVGLYAPRHAVASLTAAQLVTALAASLLLLPIEPLRLDLSHPPIAAVAYTGIAMTTGAFLVQNWAQRYVSAPRAALVYALEPVSATLLTYLLGIERLTPAEWMGGALVIGAVIAGELRQDAERSPESPPRSGT